MPTKVEMLVADRAKVAELVPALTAFLGGPNNEALLRTALLSIIPLSKNEKHFVGATERVNELFTKRGYTIRFFNNESIRRYLLGLHAATNPQLKAYLMLWLLHEIERDKTNVHNGIFDNTPLISELCDRAEKFIDTMTVEDLYRVESRVGLAQAISNVGREMQQSADDDRTIQFLFDYIAHSDNGHPIDCSYYLVYRYSTIKCEIVKTFMAIKTPHASIAKCFSFTHIYPMELTYQKRISRGPVLCFDQCLHFLGGAQVSTRNKLGRNQGLKLVSVQMGGINTHHRLLSGVFLSHALAWQPIVGRLAMVHIGFGSQYSAPITDEDVKIGVFADEDSFVEDLGETIEKFKAGQAHRLAEVQKYVLGAINNQPFFDRRQGTNDGVYRAICIEDYREPHR